MPTGKVFIAVHKLNWLESEKGKKRKKENGIFTQKKISKHRMTEQTGREYDLPVLGRDIVLVLLSKREEVLINSEALNPSLSKSFSLDSWKSCMKCKGQGLFKLIGSESQSHVNKSSQNQQ